MIRLHHVPGSRSLRVLWLLEELGLKAELREWSMLDGSLRSAEFRALSPAGRIPALEIDCDDREGETATSCAIFESGAIVQFLTEREGRLAPAIGTPDRAAFLEWVSFAETQANILQNLNFHHIFLRPEAARSKVMTVLDTKRLAITMKALEGALAGHEYLLPSGFSAADCMMGFNIGAMFRFVRADGFPNLAAYRNRLSARPAYLRAVEKGGSDVIYTRAFYEMPEATL